MNTTKTLVLNKIHTIETQSKDGLHIEKIATFATPSTHTLEEVRVKLQLIGDADEITKCLADLGCVASGQELFVILKNSNQKLLSE